MIALLILALTVVLVVWRPGGLNEAWYAALGAVLALISGVVALHDLPTLWHATWNATLTLISLIALSLLLDAAGLFRWAALHVARWGGGSGRRLLSLLVGFSALVAALFANDGGVLILTPIVLELAQALKLNRAATVAFALAVGFVVDAASLPLPISNLTNIIAADTLNWSFGEYVRVMLPVDLAVVAACLVMLLLVYGRTLPRRYDVADLPDAGEAVKSWGVFRAGWVALGVLLVGAFTAERLGIPLSAVVGACAVGVAVVASRSGRSPGSRKVPTWAVLKKAPWGVVIFSLGMYTVVYGLRGAGLTDRYGEWMAAQAGHGPLAAVLAPGLSVAALSAGLNNLPALLTALLGLEKLHGPVHGPLRDLLGYAALVGADIGPKLTPIGSLATLLWLHMLGERDIKVGWGEYLKAGLILTPPVLLVGLLTLWAVKGM